MKLSQRIYPPIAEFAASRKFFVIILALLVLQAAWIALSALYPQAFDEQFHFGVIQIYAHHLNPFLTHQPPHASQYGPLTVDGSYLYHYLMSFPYRAIAHFTHSVETQVIILRFINIALLAGGLVIWRKLLLLLPLGKAYTHMALFLFVLLPSVPLLAGQINYDNLVFLISGLSILWTVRLIQSLQKSRTIEVRALFRLIILCLLGSLVQYKFLAVAGGIFVVLIWALISARSKKHGLKTIFSDSWRAAGRLRLLIYIILCLASLGLFLQRYGVNIVRYHKIQPTCNQVLSVEECSLNGPWHRAHHNHNHNPPLSNAEKTTYIGPWVSQNIRELTFAISSSFGDDGMTVNYYTKKPLPIMFGLVWAFFAIGLLLIIRYIRRLWQLPATRNFIIISLAYVLILLAKNFQSFLHEREVVAVHGRYLLPVILLMFALGLLGLKWFFEQYFRARRAQTIKLWSLIVLILLLTQGAGLITYIARSDSSWFWNNNNSAVRVNKDAQNAIKPLIVGS